MFENNRSWYLLVAKAYVPQGMTPVEFDHFLLDQRWVVGTESVSEAREYAEAFYVIYREPSVHTAEDFFQEEGIEYELGDIWFMDKGSLALSLSDVSTEDLQEIKGIGEVLAREIWFYLRKISKENKG